MRKRVAFVTLGCKLNFSESSTFAREFESAGYERVDEDSIADLYVINTCSVTEHADKKCRQTIRKLHKKNPKAVVVVAGCYAQLQPCSIAEIEGVDAVIGAGNKGELFKIADAILEKRKAPLLYPCDISEVENIFPAFSQGDRTRSFLKIQDGCNYNCSYCTIPLARGKSRNLPIGTLVAQAREIASKGVKEIVLTGVNTGDYGRTTHEDFLDLIKALNDVEGIARYRISSIEPNLLREDILGFISSGTKFQPHFHIPLQSGSDEVLKLMRRRYDTSLFAAKIAKIRSVIPDAFIGVDVIVGTRGETPEFFEDAYRFIDSLDVTQLHVFSYSERPGTQALKIDYVVTPEEKHARSQRLLALSDEKTRAFYARHRGQEAVVLLEKPKPGMPMHGFTANYIRVETEAHPDWDNRLVRVQLGDFNEDGTALKASIQDA